MENENTMKTGSEGILLPVYFIMIGVAVCLNVFSGSGYDPVNIVVNICMFLIIGCIILWANTRCFMPVSRMVARMRYTIQTIEIDFDKSESYLWRKYKSKTKLFDNKLLDERFNEYKLESMRMSILSEHGLRCDIEDYINEYFIDATIKKGMLSIIPGVLTGLGILGTFVGLSFGLQNFNTGTAAAITNSIAPLMDGIKIAFHTSIYGMVFSLIFNFVYKKNLEDAYRTVDKFLETYHKYVLPKAESDNIQVLVNSIDAMGEKIADCIAEAMQPTHHSFYGNGAEPNINGYENDSDPAMDGYENDSDPAMDGHGNDSDPAMDGYGNDSQPAMDGYGNDSQAAMDGYGNDFQSAMDRYDNDADTE